MIRFEAKQTNRQTDRQRKWKFEKQKTQVNQTHTNKKFSFSGFLILTICQRRCFFCFKDDKYIYTDLKYIYRHTQNWKWKRDKICKRKREKKSDKNVKNFENEKKHVLARAGSSGRSSTYDLSGNLRKKKFESKFWIRKTNKQKMMARIKLLWWYGYSVFCSLFCGLIIPTRQTKNIVCTVCVSMWVMMSKQKQKKIGKIFLGISTLFWLIKMLMLFQKKKG